MSPNGKRRALACGRETEPAESHRYWRKLVMGRSEQRLSVTDIYDLGEEIAKLGLRIAVVESHDASVEDVTFLENVVSNRSNPIRFFHNEQGAKDWRKIT